tara:strand:- start:1961 stop:2212 length:252 start_codon:yes stop_codon:yes gene_type:complete
VAIHIVYLIRYELFFIFFNLQKGGIAMKFYNLKLRKSVEVDDKDVTLVTMKNGRPAARAVATVDGQQYTMFRILGKAEADKLK